MNPFYYGGVVKGIHFCNRENEINELRTDINAGMNVLIYSPRRFGKTSLVLETVRQLNYKCVYFDMFGITDQEEFINEYFNAISTSLNKPTETVIQFFKKALKIQPNIQVEIDSNGTPSYGLNFSIKENAKVLKEVLGMPFEIARHDNEKVIIIFDEFQEVSDLGLEQKIRSVIQHHQDNVSYLFLGSKKRMMEKIFLDKSKPFYKSVKRLPILGISAEDWSKYIMGGFIKHRKQINNEAIKTILDISAGFPYYTQQIAYELFNMTPKTVNSSLVDSAVKSILEKEEDLFLREWDALSLNQKKALKLIAKTGGENIYTKKTMDDYGLSNSTLKKAIEGLLTKDVIDRQNKTYYLIDPLFAYYLSIKV